MTMLHGKSCPEALGQRCARAEGRLPCCLCLFCSHVQQCSSAAIDSKMTVRAIKGTLKQVSCLDENEAC